MKWLRNAGAVLSVGGVGVYSVYRMVFGKNKKNRGLENELPKGIQYDPYAESVKKGVLEAK